METVEKQAEALGKKEEKESKEADNAAVELEKLSVGGKNKSDEKAKEEVPTTADEKEKEKEHTETKAA